MDADKQAQAEFYMEQAAILFSSADNQDGSFKTLLRGAPNVISPDASATRSLGPS